MAKEKCKKCDHEYDNLKCDMVRAAGVCEKKNNERGYFDANIWRHSASRLPWLIFLVFAALLAGLLVSYYEASFLKMPILVAIIPMLMGIAGAAGSQTSTVIIRSLAIGELTTRQYLRATWKELLISIICGGAIALVGFTYIIATERLHWELGLVLGLGLFVTIMAAKLLGIFLPIIAKKCKVDPALISSPLVTIIADIIGIFAYFSFAQWILGL